MGRSLCLKNYFDQQGILQQTTIADTPQKNGRMECKHQHILNVAPALCFHAQVPICFLGECILTAGYLINRTPSELLHGKTPFKMLHGHSSPHSQIKTFGCFALVLDHSLLKHKFRARSKPYMFMGYTFGKMGWEFFYPIIKKFILSRDAIFDESLSIC